MDKLYDEYNITLLKYGDHTALIEERKQSFDAYVYEKQLCK